MNAIHVHEIHTLQLNTNAHDYCIDHYINYRYQLNERRYVLHQVELRQTCS